MTSRKDLRAETHLIFLLARVIDILIHDMDYQLRKERMHFDKEKQREYNTYLDYAKKTVTWFDKVFEPSYQKLGDIDGFKDYEILRGQANEVIRLLLMYVDKCFTNAQAARNVHELLKCTPEGVGNIKEEDLERFNLHKRWK